MTTTTAKVDCTQCQYYFVTWEADRPHGCRFFGFKSAQSPALAVLESSGSACAAFEGKFINKPTAGADKPKTSKGWIV